MTKYILITTSLIADPHNIRMQQYTIAISQACKVFSEIPDCKIIIIENTNTRGSFLEQFTVPVFYTTNNSIQTNNKGIKELQDVFDAIKEFSIQDDDFIVKLTGRYIVEESSKFLKALKELDTQYDAITKYGGYNLPQIYMEKFYSCNTGLVGLRAKYVKQIKMPGETICVEWNWAEMINTLDLDKICMLDNLGIVGAVGSYNVNYMQM